MEFNTDALMMYATEYGIQFLMAIAIFVIGKWVAKFARNLIKKAMQRANVDATLISFAVNIAYGLTMAFVVIAALGQLGVQTASLAAILAAAGLAIGLALQGSLSNFAAGVMLIIFRPFKIGDFIEAAGASGIIEGIGIFTTNLRTGDNKTIILPNSSVTSSNIVNYSTKPTRRVDMTFGCSYDDDIKEVKKVLSSVLAADKRILETPESLVAVSELADSSVNFAVRPWVKSSDYWGVFFDITENVKIAFDKKGISMPYPQQDVYIQSMPEVSKKKA